MNGHDSRQAMVQGTSALPPRLVDLAGAAAYLAVSRWTIKEWVSSGLLPRVRFLLPNGHAVRKLLFDVRDLDALIERAKDDVLNVTGKRL